MKLLNLLPVAVAVTASTASLNAAVITPFSATSTTFHDAPRTIDSAIDGSGLSGGGTSGDILTETHGSASGDNQWLTAVLPDVTSEVVTFDLGGTFDVDTIYLWAYNRNESNRGVETFDIAFSTDGGSTFGTAVSAMSLGMANFAEGAITGSSSVQTGSITEQTGVTDIQFSNISNFGADRIAIAELRFGGTPTISEPSSVTLIGLAGLELVLHRRR